MRLLTTAEHARWEFLRAAEISQDALLGTGVGPVAPETTIRYLRELRAGDEVTVSCAFEWSKGRTPAFLGVVAGVLGVACDLLATST